MNREDYDNLSDIRYEEKRDDALSDELTSARRTLAALRGCVSDMARAGREISDAHFDRLVDAAMKVARLEETSVK